jgi:hypothetical protein
MLADRKQTKERTGSNEWNMARIARAENGRFRVEASRENFPQHKLTNKNKPEVNKR